MWSGLEHREVWYMVRNVLEEYSGCLFKDSWKMVGVYPD
jgi:hypothetical protein